MSSFNGKTILVCGGAGFIGSNFVRYIFLKYPKAKIINFDKLTYSGNRDNLKDIAEFSRYVFIKGDISDKKSLGYAFDKYKPDYVINFAAETHVDRSIHGGAGEFIKTNIEGVFNLVELLKSHKKLIKYVQVSTDEVYGDISLKSKKLFSEGTPLAPNSPYSASKAAGDLLCRAYHSTWGIPVVITRCSNNYGPYQYPEKLIPFFITRLIADKKPLVYGDGKNVRDWIHVDDHCRALLACLLSGRAGEVYNIGADMEINNLGIAGRLLKYFKKPADFIEFVTDRPGHDRRYAIDSSKIRDELKWEPVNNFEISFRKTIDWYVNNREWIDGIRRRAESFNKHIRTKRA